MENPQSFVFNSSSTSSSVFSSPTRRKFNRKNREKTVQVKAVDLKNITEYQSLHSVFTLVPDPVMVKPSKKLQQISDAPSNSPLPLIKVSRVLKGIPQSPHFFQLRKYSELARVKLIAAWDQAFEDTAKEVQDLKTKDFWVNARKLWK
ncbi:hypothetical protein TSUD_150930 [Trifolium subterraneum]|uniref:Uncharacterized protein n=1 Tax=Trifolium subterraneum TaxID=3900 RepID=A0A2Z6LYS9_TRISU|nr:hypothetical protein TSUD_150930 [Trifolium subterraneum]